MQRLRGIRICVWLGVLAVALYAWLPTHFAHHVVAAAIHSHAELVGGNADPAPRHHPHHPAGHDEHHGDICPICAAAAASAAPAAAMLPTLAALPAPRSMAASAGMVEARAVLRAASLTPYAPRGPPSA